MTQGVTLSGFQSHQEQLEYLQLQYLQKRQQLVQYQTYLNGQLSRSNQLAQSNQQQLKRSQSVQHSSTNLSLHPSSTSNSSIVRQQSTNTINELYYPQHHVRPDPSFALPSLPKPPCISLQRRDSVKSDGSSADTSSARYKTEMCRPFEETGNCRYGSKCQFAHGIQELRSLNRHPRYKTEFCRTFHTTGFCSYGQRCNFIHNEDERRAPKPQTPTTTTSRPKGLSLSTPTCHAALKSSTGSLGSAGSLMSTSSSPASSVYGDISPSCMSDDLCSRLSPTPSLSSDISFPSPTSCSPPLVDDIFVDSKNGLSSPLEYSLSISLLSSLNL